MLPKITFSFAYFLNKCIDEKIKGEYFTNKVSEKNKSEFFARIFSVLKSYSDSTLKELEHQKVCHIVKEEKISGRIVEVLQAGGYGEEWIKRKFFANHVYKFKIIVSDIRMFGIYQQNTLYVLFFDPNHLINKSTKKNFSLPSDLTCSWCVKSCNKTS